MIGVVPGVGMAQGFVDNYLENSFMPITGISSVDSKYMSTSDYCMHFAINFRYKYYLKKKDFKMS